MSRRIRLGESLVEAGLITPTQLDEALKRRTSTGERIGEALVGLGFISERDLLRTLALDADIPFLEARELVVDPMVVVARRRARRSIAACRAAPLRSAARCSSRWATRSTSA